MKIYNLICKSVRNVELRFFQLYNIRKLRKHLTFQSCHTLLQSLVVSHLDYANSLYSGLPTCVISKLQRLQNSAVRVLYRQPKCAHVTPHFREAHWLPVQYRIKFKILTLVFNSLNGNGPAYISDLLVTRTNTYHRTRSVENGDLFGPRVRTKFGERALSYAGPKLWNDLPMEIRASNCINKFIKKLKTYFYCQFFQEF